MTEAPELKLNTPPADDQLLSETCQAIVTTVAQVVDAEPVEWTAPMRLPGGPVVGRQITIDATPKGGLLNKCRLTILNAELAPEGEVARIEYDHEKQGKFGPVRVYSIQSLRRYHGELVLLENFLAESAAAVREEDFRSIQSEAYGRTTVLATVQEWAHFRAWQLQEMRKK